MQSPAFSTDVARPHRARPLGPRSALVAATVLALAAGTAWGAGAPAATLDPDLARLLRFMAALKLGFAALACAVAWWRLARPARRWRTLAYVGGPPLAAGGSILLLFLQHPGLAALILHLGLVAVLAAALTDAAFFDGVARRPGASGRPGRGL